MKLQSIMGGKNMKFELPKLTYDYNELEPSIDAMTVEIHYDRHHRGYAAKLNAALEKQPKFAKGKTINEILSDIERIPVDIRQAVINNGGGFVNHNLYWSILSPHGGGMPKGKLKEEIDKKFNSFENFKNKL